MLRTFYLIILTVITFSCNPPGGKKSFAQEVITKDVVSQSDTLVKPGSLLSLSDAERVLGERAHLLDSTAQHKEDLSTWHVAYKANAMDAHSKKTGVVYFLLEQYSDEASALKKYKYIKDANESHGIIIRQDLGDEAYFHTDNINFYFIMVRKGSKVFNMKVNKITNKTSLDEFNFIAIKITNTL